MSEEKLSNFLKTARDWERIKTSLPGIFVLKLPAYKSSPARLAVELNPVDSSGTPTKKRGLVIRGMQELEEYAKMFQYDKLSSLVASIEKVNPGTKEKKIRGEEVLEI